MASWIPGAGWLADKLLAVLSEFVEVSEKEDVIRLGVLRGEVSLRDVKLRPEVVNALGLPVAVVDARIGRLAVTVPWTRLASARVEVRVEGVAVVLAPPPAAPSALGDDEAEAGRAAAAPAAQVRS